MKNSIKNRFKIYYLPMLVLSIVFCAVFYIFWKPTLSLIPFITYTSGYLSVFLLAVSLLFGPINLILRRKNPISTYIRGMKPIGAKTYGKDVETYILRLSKILKTSFLNVVLYQKWNKIRI